MPGRRECRYEMNLNYKVEISDDALTDLRRYVNYLINVKRNPQAASNLLNDYDETIAKLEAAAGSLKPCDSPNMNLKVV